MKNIEFEDEDIQIEKIIKYNKGITLITLIITIIILIILSAVIINVVVGKNGLFTKAKEAKETTVKSSATEKMNLKITNMQIEVYSKEQRMPTLQEFADGLCIDDEIEYVELKSKSIASLKKIEVGESSSIFTKMKEYPYEFEINSSLQLASINGVKVAQNNVQEETKGCNPKLLTNITLPSTGGDKTRAVGTYLASTNSFTKKNNDNEFAKYLFYEEGKGWTVLKSGYYMINSTITIYYAGESSDTSSSIVINGNDIRLALGNARKANDYETDVNNTTIFLEKGTNINFKNNITLGKSTFHFADFNIYALFE